MRIEPRVDDVILLEGRKYTFSFKLVNDSRETLRGVPSLSVIVEEKPRVYVVFEEVELGPGAEKLLSATTRIPPGTGEGVIEIIFEEEGKVLAKEQLPILVVSDGEEIYVSFVWHHHQAPQYYPSGEYKDPWPFLHVYRGSFYAFEGGPYRVHLAIHDKHPAFRDTDHLSPSLLEQWEKAVAEGYTYNGERVEPSDQRVKSVAETLEGYRRLVSEGRIEPLGSLYAHTIQGFLLRRSRELGMERLVKSLLLWELKLGLRTVERVLGRRPWGVWTPEMFWDMDLVNLYAEAGARYTVLCQQHFERAGGEKGTIYEPYYVEDVFTGNKVVVFFRDIRLSDWLSFEVNFPDEKEADLAARRFVIELAKRRHVRPGGIVVVALDGENWMIIPQYKRYAPYFLYRIITFIERSSIIKSTTLGSYLSSRKPQATLYFVPYGSWIGLSDKQWTGGVKDETWNYVLEKLKWVEGLYDALEEVVDELLEKEESPLYMAFKAAAISLDSDFYWYGEDERERDFVKKWADEAERIARRILEMISIEPVGESDDHVLLRIKNGTEYRIKLRLEVRDKDYSSRHIVRIDPGAVREISVYAPEKGSSIVVGAGKIVLFSKER